jgi:hypothetical protein
MNTGRFSDEIAKNSFMKTTGFSVSLGKQLKWPDDYLALFIQLASHSIT